MKWRSQFRQSGSNMSKLVSHELPYALTRLIALLVVSIVPWIERRACRGLTLTLRIRQVLHPVLLFLWERLATGKLTGSSACIACEM